jgi:two-component system, NarL family, invasion response regulator UvrY
MRVLIVEDHPIVRAALQCLFAAEADIETREAGGGREALALFSDYRPDVVVLDLGLPDLKGLDVIARLKERDPAARILVLSMHHDALHVTNAFETGAAGYLSKHAPPDQILEAVRRVADGSNYLEHDLAREFATGTMRAAAHPLKVLSRRDVEILRLLGKGCNLPEIARALGISYRTVAIGCSQIKIKLGATRTADLIRIAVQYGLAADDADTRPE